MCVSVQRLLCTAWVKTYPARHRARPPPQKCCPQPPRLLPAPRAGDPSTTPSAQPARVVWPLSPWGWLLPQEARSPDRLTALTDPSRCRPAPPWTAAPLSAPGLTGETGSCLGCSCPPRVGLGLNWAEKALVIFRSRSGLAQASQSNLKNKTHFSDDLEKVPKGRFPKRRASRLCSLVSPREWHSQPGPGPLASSLCLST